MIYQNLPHSRRIVVVEDIEIGGYLVPNGFQSDGASGPRLLWLILGSPHAPETVEATTVHDYIYSTHAAPRLVADDVMFRIMRRDKVGWLRAMLYHLGVRIFGWLFW